MKFVLNSLIVILLMVGTVSAQVGKAIIEFEKKTHDYGTFKEEAGLQSYTFKFTNKGNVPLLLNNVQPSCGCTTPEWARKPVAPGQEGYIKVAYNPKGHPGQFTKSIRVISNASNSSEVLYIKGTVIPREKTIEELYPNKIGEFRVKSNHIALTKITENEVKTETIELVNDTDHELPLKFKQAPFYMTINTSTDLVKPGEKATLTVTYDASKKNTYGFVMERVYLDMEGKFDYKNAVVISATIEEDFSKLSEEDMKNAPVATIEEKTFDFGEIKQGESVTHIFTLKNTGKDNLIIRKLSTSCGCTAVTPEKKIIGYNESVPLKVEFNSRGKRGRQNKSITLITNDPKNSTSILRISGNVVTEQ